MSNPTRISVHRDCGGDLLEDYEDAYRFEGEDALLFGEIVPRILCAKCGQEILGDAEIQFVGAAAYLEEDRPMIQIIHEWQVNGYTNQQIGRDEAGQVWWQQWQCETYPDHRGGEYSSWRPSGWHSYSESHGGIEAEELLRLVEQQRALRSGEQAGAEHVVRRACPCLHTTPCHPKCTCISPVSSRGCRRCCSYGSPDQQRAMAEMLAAAIDPHRARLQRVEEVRREMLAATADDYGCAAAVDDLRSWAARLADPAPEAPVEVAEDDLKGDFMEHLYTPDRAAPKDCRHEPPFPLHETTMVSLSAPETTAHRPTNRCAQEQPHSTSECGEWQPAPEPAATEAETPAPPGTFREICCACNLPSPIGFRVPDLVWRAAVPLRYRGVLCAQCFARFADEAGIDWTRDIELYPVSLAMHREGVEPMERYGNAAEAEDLRCDLCEKPTNSGGYVCAECAARVRPVPEAGAEGERCERCHGERDDPEEPLCEKCEDEVERGILRAHTRVVRQRRRELCRFAAASLAGQRTIPESASEDISPAAVTDVAMRDAVALLAALDRAENS